MGVYLLSVPQVVCWYQPLWITQMNNRPLRAFDRWVSVSVDCFELCASIGSFGLPTMVLYH